MNTSRPTLLVEPRHSLAHLRQKRSRHNLRMWFLPLTWVCKTRTILQAQRWTRLPSLPSPLSLLWGLRRRVSTFPQIEVPQDLRRLLIVTLCRRPETMTSDRQHPPFHLYCLRARVVSRFLILQVPRLETVPAALPHFVRHLPVRLQPLLLARPLLPPRQ